jgi:hypothetical protein
MSLLEVVDWKCLQGTFQICLRVCMFILLCMFCSVYSVSLCCSVHCLCVNYVLDYCHRDIGALRLFCAFSSVVRQMPRYNSQTQGMARTSQFFFIVSVFRSLYSVYCLCVNVYCTTATGCQPNCC